MRLFSPSAAVLVAGATCLATASASASSSSPSLHMRRVRALAEQQQRSEPATPVRRAPPTTTLQASGEVQTSIVNQAATDPIGAAIAADSLFGIYGDTVFNDQSKWATIQGNADNTEDPQANQYPWNQNIAFPANANAQAGNNPEEQGWAGLPPLANFDLNRTWVVPGTENATQPFYISQGWQSKAQFYKRAIIVMPGKPRDSWKYTNLVNTALNVTSVNKMTSPEVTFDDVLVIGPAWLNEADQSYGATEKTDLVFHGSQWQSGGYSRAPNMTKSVTTYDVLDGFTDWLFDRKNFPALTSVSLAGHSMGGQAVMRYALLKKTKSYDPNMHFWIGNPGSWAWLTPERPFSNATCLAPDEWGYGIGGNQTKVTKYARKDVIADKKAVVARFRTRNVHYALGLLDNGPGDTHCEAVLQGGNHLDRGCQFAMAFADNGGWPEKHTLDFVANVTHQDFAMLSANVSLQRIFADGIATRLPGLTKVTNPGDRSNTSGPVANPAPRAFATPIHKIISYALMGGSIGGIILAFCLLPFIFPSNSDPWEQEQWEAESKRKLL